MRSDYSRSLSSIHLTSYSFTDALSYSVKNHVLCYINERISLAPQLRQNLVPKFVETWSHSASTHVCICMSKHVYVYITFAFIIKILLLVIKQCSQYMGI